MSLVHREYVRDTYLSPGTRRATLALFWLLS